MSVPSLVSLCSPVSYSRHESSRARELLASVAQLQPLVFGLVEELLSVSQEQNAARLQQVLDSLTQQVRRGATEGRGTYRNRIVTQTRLPSFTQTQLFVHALKDELVEKALLAIGSLRSADRGGSHVHSNGLLCELKPANQEEEASPWQQDSGRRDPKYNEEEWASRSVCPLRWFSVGLCLFSYFVCVCV